MLKKLSIQNYALIDRLEVELNDGLTIITGETGAGKSILLGALGLIAGSRADTQALQDKSKKCLVEATFEISKYSLEGFFEKHELDYEKESSIRREINPEGKSRAFINDTPVTLQQLKELAEQLIDIHSQHQTLSLNGVDFQLSVVDAFAKHGSLLIDYQANFHKYRQLSKQLEELFSREIKAKKDLDYLQFQFNELDHAELKAGSQEQMEQELATLNNAEQIKSQLTKAAFVLNGGEQNMLSSLSEVRTSLQALAKYKSEIAELSSRINSSFIELKDIAAELDNLEQEIIHDPDSIELLNGKLDQIYRLQQKHHVKSIEELIDIKGKLSAKLLEFSSLEAEIEKTKFQVNALETALMVSALQITNNRKKAIPRIEKEINVMLASLAMPNAQLKIILQEADALTLTGRDKLNFLFAANKGSELRELNKVASGGELSRLMLSIKSLLAKVSALPTILFDEIDTGVSGDVADKVGGIMHAMSEDMQVITITHLPQIASKGKTHLLVYKEEKSAKTFSNIRKLTNAERIDEIAKMLSTGNPGAAAISNAKELLKSSL